MSNPRLAELHPSGATDGQVPVFDAGTGLWAPGTVAAGGGGGGGGSSMALRAAKTTDQSITTSTWTALTYDTESVDTNAIHDTSTNPTRLTIPTGGAGRWFVAVRVKWDNNSTGERQHQLYKNGSIANSDAAISAHALTASGSFFTSWTVVDLVDAADGDYLEWKVWQDSGGTRAVKSVQVFAFSLGGAAAASSIKDRRWTAGPAETSYDEFNDSSLDAAWVRVDPAGGSSRMVVTEAADVLSLLNAGGDSSAQLHAVMRPLTGLGGSLAAGDGFVTCLTLHAPLATNLPVGGLVFADGITHGAGNQVTALQYSISPGPTKTEMHAFTNYGTDGTVADSKTWAQGLPMWMRLVMTAANTWRLDTSLDGVSWLNGAAALSKTLTPTHVGVFCSSWGASTAAVFSYECFRRVSGV